MKLSSTTSFRHWATSALLAAGCTPIDSAEQLDAPEPHVEAPADPVVPQVSGKALDVSAPFTLWLGRGSARFGLDVVQIVPSGDVVFVRLFWEQRDGANQHFPQRADLTLDVPAMREVAELVLQLQLASLDDDYINENVYDGSQWILMVTQDELERVVYFDNRFPPRIMRFARDIDALLAAEGLEDSDFERIPRAEAAELENVLWTALESRRERANEAEDPSSKPGQL